MELKLNEKYELEVIEICNSSKGDDYFFALGPDDKLYHVYDILKFQYVDEPKSIVCKVVGFDINGKARLMQDKCALIQEHYPLGHYYLFHITDKTDDNKGRPYYQIEDDYCQQRWYSNDDGYSIGDDVILEAKSLTNKGYIHYEPKQDEKTIKIKEEKQVRIQPAGNLPVFAAGAESLTLEYKTSIVFLPGNHEPDIDTQMFSIVREIAAFMNAVGGTLYIGIHDKSHEIYGIDKDLQYLNSGKSTYTYTADYDHYQLKIRDELKLYCGGVAGSLVDISFPEQEGVTYCKVDVKPAKRPIWCKGNMLFQRQGNQAQMLKGEALTQFVGERIGSYILSMAKEENVFEMPQVDMTSLIHNAVKSAINDRRKSVAATVKTPDTGEVKYWIVWYNDGTWKKQRQQSTDTNVFLQLPLTEDAANVNVVFCYKSGTVNRVKMADFVKGANMNAMKKGGMYSDETPANIFICHPSDLIAVYSSDSGGSEYIKIHHVTDFNPTGSGKNKGSYIIPKDKGQVLEFKLMTAVQSDRVKSLVANKRDTTSSFGRSIHDITVQEEIKIVNDYG